MRLIETLHGKGFQNAIIIVISFLMSAEFTSHSLFLTFFLFDGLEYIPLLAGSIIASYFIAWLLFASQAGSLSDKYGWKLFIILGSIISGVCFLLQPLWNNFIYLLILNIANGLGNALLLGPVLALIAHNTPEKNYSSIMGTYYAAKSIASIVGLVVGSLAWDLLNIYGSPVFSLYCLLIIILVLISGTSEGRDVEKVVISEIKEFRDVLNPFNAIIDGWKQQVFRKYAIAWLAFSTLVAGGGQYMPVILVDLSNGALDATDVLILLVPVILFVTLAQPIIGYLADKFGRIIFQYLGIIGAMSLVALIGLLAFQDIFVIGGTGGHVLSFLTNPLSFNSINFFSLISIPTILFTVLLLLAVALATCFVPSSMGILLAGINEEEKAKSLELFNALVGSGTFTGVFFGALFLGLFGYAGVIIFCFLMTCMLWAVKFG
ncbi:MAG: MFS transporter [Candidatus Hodarchaeales archaeon]